MEVKLSRTTFDKIEIGETFCLIKNDRLIHFVKLPFEKASNVEDDSINHFQKWSGVFLPPVF
jgi:hypothetical protein